MKCLAVLLVVALVGCTIDPLAEEPIVSPPTVGSTFVYKTTEGARVKIYRDSIIASGDNFEEKSNVVRIQRINGERRYISYERNGDIYLKSHNAPRWNLRRFGSRPEIHIRDSSYNEGYGYYLREYDTVYRDTTVSMNGIRFDGIVEEVRWWGETYPIGAEVIELGTYTDHSIWIPELGMFARDETRPWISTTPVEVLDSYVLK